jgi:hypothetical protein
VSTATSNTPAVDKIVRLWRGNWQRKMTPELIAEAEAEKRADELAHCPDWCNWNHVYPGALAGNYAWIGSGHSWHQRDGVKVKGQFVAERARVGLRQDHTNHTADGPLLAFLEVRDHMQITDIQLSSDEVLELAEVLFDLHAKMEAGRYAEV